MANLQFWRSNQLSDTSFLDLVKRTFGKTFTKGIDAKNWLITNGYYTSYPDIDVTRNYNAYKGNFGL